MSSSFCQVVLSNLGHGNEQKAAYAFLHFTIMKTYKFAVREGSPIHVSVVYSDSPTPKLINIVYEKINFTHPLEAIVTLTALKAINSGILLHLDEELKAQRRMSARGESQRHYDTAIGLVSDVIVGRYDRMFE